MAVQTLFSSKFSFTGPGEIGIAFLQPRSYPPDTPVPAKIIGETP
jgi:hypothetical protein